MDIETAEILEELNKILDTHLLFSGMSSPLDETDPGILRANAAHSAREVIGSIAFQPLSAGGSYKIEE